MLPTTNQKKSFVIFIDISLHIETVYINSRLGLAWCLLQYVGNCNYHSDLVALDDTMSIIQNCSHDLQTQIVTYNSNSSH